MEEQILSIYKELENLNPSEKTKYMAKLQEEFLKSIDSKELLERIRKFRTLNIRDMKEQEIADAISKVLTWNGKFSYITNSGTYPAGTPFLELENLMVV